MPYNSPLTPGSVAVDLLSFRVCTEVHSVTNILANKDLVIWIIWVITIANIQNLLQLPLKMMEKLPFQ